MQQLQAHADKIACVDFSVLELRLKINRQGLLESVSSDLPANVTLRINPADIPLIMQDRARAMSYVRLEGDADLAQALSELGKNVRWDLEQQLSDLFGDLAGRRMAGSGRAAFVGFRETARKVQENLAEYFLEENPMLIRPASVTDFAEQVSRTRDDTERLMKRIEKLEKTQK